MAGQWKAGGVALALLLAGCGAKKLESGQSNTCLYVDDAPVAVDTVDVNLQISGTVVSDEPFADGGGWCSAVATRAFTLTGVDGATYRLGYGLADADERDLTPGLPVAAGDDVSLHFRYHQDFGTAGGFVLTRDDRLVAALEMGTWGSGLALGDVPGLTVSAGAVLGTEVDECGLKTHYELRFDGDDDRRLAPVDHDAVPIDGEDYDAYALARFEWADDTQCTDLAGEEMWAVWAR